jgi:hypothetical protein
MISDENQVLQRLNACDCHWRFNNFRGFFYKDNPWLQTGDQRSILAETCGGHAD